MATAQQIKALIKSFSEGDETRFYRVALQLAASEARRGHVNVARDLRELVDDARSKNQLVERPRGPVPITQPRGELEGILTASFPKVRLTQMVLSEEVERSLRRLLAEHRKEQKLRAHGLRPRRKILLVGPPGTGKTMTARAIAGELSLPLFVVRLEGLITRFMGETAAKLALVFEAMTKQRGIYLFDEFDSIGSHRGATNDVGEIRRVLNSFLQFIEADQSNSITIAATNHRQILDYALFRRFDDVIRYDLPNKEQVVETLVEYLVSFQVEKIDWSDVAEQAIGLSYAEIVRACEDAAKDMILADEESVSQQRLVEAIDARLQDSERSSSVS